MVEAHPSDQPDRRPYGQKTRKANHLGPLSGRLAVRFGALLFGALLLKGRPAITLVIAQDVDQWSDWSKR